MKRRLTDAQNAAVVAYVKRNAASLTNTATPAALAGELSEALGFGIDAGQARYVCAQLGVALASHRNALNMVQRAELTTWFDAHDCSDWTAQEILAELRKTLPWVTLQTVRDHAPAYRRVKGAPRPADRLAAAVVALAHVLREIVAELDPAKVAKIDRAVAGLSATAGPTLFDNGRNGH